MDLIYVVISHQRCEASRYPELGTIKWIELHSMESGVTNVQHCVVGNLSKHQEEQLNEGKRLFVTNEDNNFIGYLITNEAYIEQIKMEENSALNFGTFKWIPDLVSDLEHLVSVTERKNHIALPFDLSVYFVTREVLVKLSPKDMEVISEDVTYDKDGNFVSRDAVPCKQSFLEAFDIDVAGTYPPATEQQYFDILSLEKQEEFSKLSLEEKERILNSKVIKPLTTLDSTIAGCPAVSLLGPATKVDDVEGSEVYIEVEVEDAYLIDEAKAKALSVLKDMTLSDNPTLNTNVEKFKATEYNEALDNFDLFNDKDKQ